jgi:hypothetical protein
MSNPQQVWRSYIDAWNRHNVDAILDSVTEDFIYDERPATMDQRCKGGRRFVHTLSAPSPRFRISAST